MSCWQEQAERRPTFEALQNQLEDFFIGAEKQYADTGGFWKRPTEPLCRWIFFRSFIFTILIRPMLQLFHESPNTFINFNTSERIDFTDFLQTFFVPKILNVNITSFQRSQLILQLYSLIYKKNIKCLFFRDQTASLSFIWILRFVPYHYSYQFPSFMPFVPFIIPTNFYIDLFSLSLRRSW